MIIIEKDTYTIDEAIEEINNEGIKAARSDIEHLGEKGLLKFHIKLGYRTAIAIQIIYADKEKKNVEDINFIGICNISGLAVVLPTDFTALLHKEKHEIHSIVGTSFCNTITISNWRTNILYDMQLITPQVAEIWKPVEFNETTIIDAFFLKPEYGFQPNNKSIDEHIPISNLTPHQLKSLKQFGSGILRQINFNWKFQRNDLCILKNDLKQTIKYLKQKPDPKNPKVNTTKPDGRKSESTDALREYIRFIFKTTKKGFTEFTRMLENEYSEKQPYQNEEYEYLTNVYIKNGKIHFRYKTSNDDMKADSRSKLSIKRFFTP